MRYQFLNTFGGQPKAASTLVMRSTVIPFWPGRAGTRRGVAEVSATSGRQEVDYISDA